MSDAIDLLPEPPRPTFVAFLGETAIAAGALREVAAKAKAAVDADRTAPLMVYNAVSSTVVELDLRGSLDDVLERIPFDLPIAISPGSADVKPGRGRPKLGVVAREVTLLPRHWEWLAEQEGGASVTLRKLVESARRTGGGAMRLRRAQHSAYRFMAAMLGNHPGFEEATRALFAGDAARFAEHAAPWPPDLREHATRLATTAFLEQDSTNA